MTDAHQQAGGRRGTGSAETNRPSRRRNRTSFKKGQSGNSRGRPRGSRNHKTIVKDIANETHQVNEQGKRHTRTMLGLVFVTLRNLAMTGKPSAFKLLRHYLTKYQPQPASQTGGYVLMPPEITPEESPFPVEYVDETTDHSSQDTTW